MNLTLIRNALEKVGLRVNVVLVVVLVLVGSTWGFIELADDVLEGDTQKFDDWAIRKMRRPDNLATPIGPRWLHEMGRDFTALGGLAFLSMLSLFVAGYFFFVRKFHAMWLVLAATVGGSILSMILKRAFSRDRPDLVPHLSQVYTSSFPSGHSMLSACVYLTLGAMLARLVPGRLLKLYFICTAMTLTFLVGVSRVYMGVHYPTDVLAGWTAGLIWALIIWLVARYLQRHGTVERDVEDKSDEAGRGFSPINVK